MPIVFDPAARRIVLDTAAVTATEIYSRWVDWAASNLQYEPAFRQVGGDDLGSGLSIPPYYFLQNGWKVRPMEASHNLTITGNLFVDGGGVPVVPTLGTYQVNVNYTVPVQAQGISTGGSGGLTTDQAQRLERIEKFLRNKQISNPATGMSTIYEDDGATPWMQAPIKEDAAGAQPYRRQGIDRRERYVAP